MVNGPFRFRLGRLAGIEAEAAMLGQPISMLLPEVVGFKTFRTIAGGRYPRQILFWTISSKCFAAKGVVGKFVEFYGEGLDSLSLEDQANDCQYGT